MMIRVALLGLGMMVGACAPLPGDAPAPQPLIEDTEVRIDAAGRCFATYAVGDPVMTTSIEQVEVIPAQYDPDGMLVNPPVFRNEEVTRETTPAPTEEFEMVCPDAMTPEFVGNLQRALGARGVYTGPITGLMDDQTRAAIRLFQLSGMDLSLNSSVLSIVAARDLGLVSLSEDQIDALQ